MQQNSAVCTLSVQRRLNFAACTDGLILLHTNDSAPSPSGREESAIIISRGKLVNYGGDTSGGELDELHVLDLDASE